MGQAYSLACFLAALAAAAFLDRLTGVLLVLSTFLFAVVCRYSNRYLMGDTGQPRFTFWLCLTGSCVFALVLSQNLLLFSLAWCGVSLSLHHLLQFYRNRPGALLAARKKFLISRLGDAALAGALILTFRQFGTWDFQRIFIAAEYLRTAGIDRLPHSVSWICALLVFAALLKSAQFPFHSWLPDTMETPTPVSALMHAGIINAGGILIIRLSPLVSLSPTSLCALCLVGAFTALFASIVMLTQASVKRCLAFSTVAQMGFMMLECGLGAFHLALLHIVAHSLYKAHAFLSSGSAVLANPQAPKKPVTAATIGAGLLLAFTIVIPAAWYLGLPPLKEPVLVAILCMALAQMLWATWPSPLSIMLAVIFSFTYFAFGRAAEQIVKPVRNEIGWLALPIVSAFAIVAVAQSQLPRLSRASFGKHLFVYARNGFYLNTLANRITASLWPVNVPMEEN